MLVRTSPSEYVVRIGRNGEVQQAGQGLSFWAWPWETYVRFPATLQWMLFSASQITQENQGVHVKGTFTWRVTDPLLAWKQLNFDRVSPEEVRELLGRRSCEPERYADPDQSPLMRTTLLIRQLAESVTRNALANMTLEEALRDRRAILRALAEQLDAVITPWGIAVSSIEIVDVTVASSEVFEHMQAEYREQLRQQAQRAHIAADEDISQHEASSQTRRQAWEHDRALAALALESEAGQRRVEVHDEIERRSIAVEAGLDMERTLADARRRQAELEAVLARSRQRMEMAKARQLAKLEITERRQQVYGQANDACRSQEIIMRLPRLLAQTKPDHATVFANSLPSATVEGIGASLIALGKAAGLKLAE